MNDPLKLQKPPTVSGLADLQAEAHAEAFAQGLAEGREAGRGEVRAQVERLAGMFYDLAKPFEVLNAEVERELLTLAMALARQIVRRELKTDPTTIIEDPVMARGGCQITTTTSRIDARLETRLAAILSELMGTERHASHLRGG